MKTNFFKWFLRGWIALVSAAAFVMGWLFLGHSSSPVSAGESGAAQPLLTPLPTLVPITASGSSSGSSMQPFTQQPFSQPMFRSRGS